MEVVKKGRIPRGCTKKFRCSGKGNGGGGCGALLLVSEYDVYETVSEHYDGSADYYNTFCCSECGVETDIVNKFAEPKGKRPSEKERKRRALKEKTK